MGRILAIDYGQKRAGLAVTDPLGLIANGLTTVHVRELLAFLRDYLAKEQVDLLVVGQPKDMRNRPSDASQFIEPFVGQLKKHFPGIPVVRMDERFTSKLAMQTMIDAGLGKMARRNKALADTISATLILQSFLEQQAKTPKQP